MWVPGIELSSVGKYLDPMSHLTDPRGTFNFENCLKLCPCVSVHMLASAHEYRLSQRWHYQQLWAAELGSDLRSSARALSALTHWAISPVPAHLHNKRPFQFPIKDDVTDFRSQRVVLGLVARCPEHFSGDRRNSRPLPRPSHSCPSTLQQAGWHDLKLNKWAQMLLHFLIKYKEKWRLLLSSRS